MEDKNRERIIDAAVKLFNYRGYKNVTMREIAKQLGMSSKTFYNYFSSKEEIAEEVIMALMRNIKEKNLQAQYNDPVIKLKEQIHIIRLELTQINPLLLKDIMLYAPILSDKLIKMRVEAALVVETLIGEGQKQGLIKKNIDPKMAAYSYIGILKAIVNPDMVGNLGYSTDEVLDFLMEIFFYGICEKQ